MGKKILIGIILFFALVGLAFSAVWVAMQLGLLNVRGSIDERNGFFGNVLGTHSCEQCEWQATPEWATVREGLRKDKEVLARVSSETGVSARLIAAVAVPEQLRFFTSEREVYKRVFEPLKILGSLSQFSLGITGIKQATAEEVERRANSWQQQLIAYPAGIDRKQELYTRLTEPKDHYYSYLYTALYIRQIMDEWASAGHPLGGKPGIVITLFNIGFVNSEPKADPQVGGADITIGGTTYTFGSLGESFYHSDELMDIFLR